MVLGEGKGDDVVKYPLESFEGQSEDIALRIVGKLSELNALLADASRIGVGVDMTVRRDERIGAPADQLVLSARVTRLLSAV